MKEKKYAQEIEIKNPLGLRFRSIARFVRAAHRFDCNVAVTVRGKTVDGKSMLSMSSLFAKRGARLNIMTDGVDSRTCMNDLTSNII